VDTELIFGSRIFCGSLSSPITTSRSPFPPNRSRKPSKRNSSKGTSRQSHLRISSFVTEIHFSRLPSICPAAPCESFACTRDAATWEPLFPRTPRSKAQKRKSASTGSPTNRSCSKSDLSRPLNSSADRISPPSSADVPRSDSAPSNVSSGNWSHTTRFRNLIARARAILSGNALSKNSRQYRLSCPSVIESAKRFSNPISSSTCTLRKETSSANIRW